MGHEDSPSRRLCAVGMCWDCWCLIFLLGFVLPSCPLGGSPESASSGHCRVSPGLGSAPGPHWGRAQGLVLRCGAVPARCWGLYLCVSSLTPLPLLSVLLFCLNGADALLLGGLLSSFQAFGFGVYCFFFPPPCINRHSCWQPV